MRTTRPTLLNGCRWAATAEEARFRIQGREDLRRVTRVIALDEGATDIVARSVALGEWKDTHFLSYQRGTASTSLEDGHDLTVDALLRNDDRIDATLRSLGTEACTSTVSRELSAADVLIMVATSPEAAEGASVVGEAGIEAGIMTAGLVLTTSAVPAEDIERTVALLRPTSMVLLVSREVEDLPQLLTAIRA